jgi:ABC-type uncharacterized transport system fused permease/ATPase subunit
VRSFFRGTLARLRENYHSLFLHFGFLNFWLAAWDQVLILFPYVVAAPLLFADDPENRISLGTLIKLSNSFEKVFGSFSVISENWGAINEFRSVLRRLREFEDRLYGRAEAQAEACDAPPPRGRLLPPAEEAPRSDAAKAERQATIELPEARGARRGDERFDVVV